ncbi:glutamine synthetase [Pseudohyphozyma bogoriensis]|nr:glutamine synthetase [Pseudohyphozyma bogoriensis]
MTISTATTGAPSTLAEVTKLLANDTKVKVAGVDADGVLRGKLMSKEKFLSAVKGNGFGFSSTLFGWDQHDLNYSPELLVSNKENGFRDIEARIDLSTYRRIPWEDNAAFFLLTFWDPLTNEPLAACPRAVLANALAPAKERGWQGMSGIELEYFHVRETPITAESKGWTGLDVLTPGSHCYSIIRPTLNKEYFNALYDESLKFGVNIEGHHTEAGPGVFETALAYCPAERMADNTSLFKLVAKSIGMNFGILPTFMAKPYADQAGTSGHIHTSLRDAKGRNIFAVSEAEEAAGGRANAANKDVKYISQEAEWFLAGILEGLPDVMPMLAPNVNSYKRLAAGEHYYAPNLASYGYDSRVDAIRVISPPCVPASATRFEIRVPGADLNPYYAMAAIYALGMDGIKRQAVLSTKPGRAGAPKLARNLLDATREMMKPESAARRVIGDFFVDHFGGTRIHEIDLWQAAVSDWESRRYFELA